MRLPTRQGGVENRDKVYLCAALFVEQRFFKQVHYPAKRMEPRLPKTWSTRRALLLKFGHARK